MTQHHSGIFHGSEGLLGWSSSHYCHFSYSVMVCPVRQYAGTAGYKIVLKFAFSCPDTQNIHINVWVIQFSLQAYTPDLLLFRYRHVQWEGMISPRCKKRWVDWHHWRTEGAEEWRM